MGNTATVTATAPVTLPGAVAPVNPAAYPGGVPLTAVITAVAANPKKPGSAAYARYALYPAPGATLAAALKAGVTRADFLYDLRKGYLAVSAS